MGSTEADVTYSDHLMYMSRQGIADQRGLVRPQPASGREGQHHAGMGFAAEPGIVAGDEIEVRHEAERVGLSAGRGFGVVGGDAEPEALPDEPFGQVGGPTDRCQAAQPPIAEQLVHLAVERGRRPPFQRLSPERAVARRRSRHQGRGRQEAALGNDVFADPDERGEGLLVRAGEGAHDLVGRGAPGRIEIDESAVLVEQDRPQRHAEASEHAAEKWQAPFGQRHAQLLGNDHVHAFGLIQSKRIAI